MCWQPITIGCSPFQPPCIVDVFNTSDPSALPIFQTTVSSSTITVYSLPVIVTAGASISLPVVIAQTGPPGSPGTTPSLFTTYFPIKGGHSRSCTQSVNTGTPSPTLPISSTPLASGPSSISSLEAPSGTSDSTSTTQKLSASDNTPTSSGSSIQTSDGSQSPPLQSPTGSTPLFPLSSTEPQTVTSTSPAATTSGPDASLSNSRSNSTNHSPPAGTIAGVVLGSLAVIALIVLARCLFLRRRRDRRRAVETQTLVVSPYPSYLSWLPHKSSRAARSSYQTSQAESLCSDSQLSVSEVESKQPLAMWNPARFVGRRTSGEIAAPRLRLPARAEQELEAGLPSGTPATVASSAA